MWNPFITFPLNVHLHPDGMTLYETFRLFLPIGLIVIIFRY
ncbi:hypothetical protein VCRA2119O48_110035 [Vibrio crassostreae]|nr:hypothetical protein VCRA2119O48_110035 [Vibrio crassostreae]CAK3923081.1 hypothetical protein VCRA212O16_380034 [Vibrio crassostreae]